MTISVARTELELVYQSLCSAFAYHLDHGDFDALAGLFTSDGVFERNGARLVGQEAILDAYAQRPSATTAHLISNTHLIEVTDTLIHASSMGMVVHAMGASDRVLKFDPAAAIRILEFEDRFISTPRGWRFCYRKARPILESSTWPGV